MTTLTGSSQTKEIDYPEIEKVHTEYLMINRLTANDSLTILGCDAYHPSDRPVKISSDAFLRGKSGKEYKLIRAEGLETDKEILLPKSKTKSFMLCFEPLDKTETSFDLFTRTEDKEGSLQGIKIFKTAPDAPVQCLIKGEVIDRPYSNRFVLRKYGTLPRIGNGIYIPIKDGKFEYMLQCEDTEGYELFFEDELINKYVRAICFIAENGTVSMKLHPLERRNENIIEGGKLNTGIQSFSTQRNSLFFDRVNAEMEELEKNDRKYSEAAKRIITLSKTADSQTRDSLAKEWGILSKTDDEYSEEAKALDKKIIELKQKAHEWELEYFKSHISLASHFIMQQRMAKIEHNPLGEALYIEVFNNYYKEKYAGHPITQSIHTRIDALTKVQKG